MKRYLRPPRVPLSAPDYATVLLPHGARWSAGMPVADKPAEHCRCEGPCARGFDSSHVEARSLSGRLRCSWSPAWPCRLGCDWTPIPLLRHLATRDQYHDHDRHVSDGFVIETTQNRVAKANSTEAS